MAVVRVSQNVDPGGMIFNALLYRGDTLLNQRTPDGGQIELPPDPQPLDRQMTFTFVPDTSFTAGRLPHHLASEWYGDTYPSIYDHRLPAANGDPNPVQSHADRYPGFIWHQSA